MNGPRAPVHGARMGIGLAVRALPASADRDRVDDGRSAFGVRSDVARADDQDLHAARR